MSKLFIIIGGLLGLVAVALGSFGSHGLKGRVSDEMIKVFEVGVRYQFIHTLAIILTAILIAQFQQSMFVWSGWFFLIGTILFSGSLYGLVVIQNSFLGMMTPIGGVFLILGWLFFLIAGFLI